MSGKPTSVSGHQEIRYHIVAEKRSIPNLLSLAGVFLSPLVFTEHDPMSKKIFFFNLPAHGHINPTIPIVTELVQQGIQVIYYNSEQFRSTIERTGADFRSYPEPNLTPEKTTELASNLVRMTVFLLTESDRLLPFLLAELEREQPDLVIYDSIALWGMQAATILGFPRVSSISTLVLEGVKGILNWRDMLHLVWRALPTMPKLLQARRQLEETYGKSVFPNKAIFPCIGQTNMVYTSREFQPETSFINDTFYFTGPSIDSASRLQVDFPWHRLDNGRSHIYISLGTIHNTDTAFYKMVFETFGSHPGQFILSAGQQTDIASLGSIPDNFIVCATVPQLELLPKVDAFVTHAGINSLNEGLYFGVPLIALPHHVEQAINARTAVRQGAAIALGDSSPYGRIQPDQLRKAVDTILRDKTYQHHAQRIGDSFRAAGGHQTAVNHILQRLASPMA